MVMNYGYARGGRWDIVQSEIEGVVQEAHQSGALVKVIFETSQLTLEQIKKGTEVCILAGADFVKTSHRFQRGGRNAGRRRHDAGNGKRAHQGQALRRHPQL